MSYTNQTFANHEALIDFIKTDAIAEGWTLIKDGDDDGSALRRILILRDPLNRFDSCFRINVDTYNDFTQNGTIDIQTCINYDVNLSFTSQPSGDDDNHTITLRSKLKLNAIVSIDSTRIYVNTNQNGWFGNFYTGRLNSYKIATGNDEDLITLSNKQTYGSNEIVYTRNDNFLTVATAYVDGSWKGVYCHTANYYKIQPSENGAYTIFPIIIYHLNNKTLGELHNLYGIGGVNVLTYSTFTLSLDNYIVVDTNDTRNNFLALKQ